jgi:hypothetical protein
MSATQTGPDGSYRYIPGVMQYSAGVTAMPGYRIHRVALSRPLPLRDGFARIAAELQAQGRPLTAFCACELNSPAPFTEDGFKAFNTVYAGILAEWGVVRDGVNPVARSNTCPILAPPAEPSFHAFCYTVADATPKPSFVVAGSGEAAEGHANYRDQIVALGDISAAGLRSKAVWVLGEMERRMAALDAVWAGTTAVQLYCVHDVFALLQDEFGTRGAARPGVTWHLNRPPVVDLEYEMDCRGLPMEQVLDV